MGAEAKSWSRLADRRLVLLGPPGSGKGTQAALLSDRTGMPAISTGRMLRQAVRAEDELGERVKDLLASGELVDDATMAEVVRERLRAGDAASGFVLDGYPRTSGQAEDLDRILDELSVRLDAVVAVEVPEEELVQRTLKRQRADDRDDVIRERLRVYHRETEPLIGHYRRRGLLRQVDGHQSIDQVFEAILTVLNTNGDGNG